jgi:hypothetical protein
VRETRGAGGRKTVLFSNLGSEKITQYKKWVKSTRVFGKFDVSNLKKYGSDFSGVWVCTISGYAFFGFCSLIYFQARVTP